MLTKTSLSAVRSLVHIANSGSPEPIPHTRIARNLGESPTYLAKVTSLLAKTGILRAERGAKGGVALGRAPAEITLLNIVEACQGNVLGNYCRAECGEAFTCSYHEAAQELERAVVGVLSSWTLEQLMHRPQPAGRLPEGLRCAMSGAMTGAMTGLTEPASGRRQGNPDEGPRREESAR